MRLFKLFLTALAIFVVGYAPCAGAKATGSPAGVLRINIPADPAMLDPITYSEMVSGDIIINMYEALTGIAPDGSVQSRLAERWEMFPDQKGFHFYLRKGVKFHSGREFTAKDVKYTFEALLTPGSKAGLGLRYFSNVVGAKELTNGTSDTLSGLTVLNDYEFEIHFLEPDATFPIYPIYIMDSGVVKEFGERWMDKMSAGTGPFKFVKWNRGREVRLAAHTDYWGTGPYLSEIVFTVVPDLDTAISMFEAGQIDVVTLREEALRRVLHSEKIKQFTHSVAAGQIQYLGLNQQVYPPFKDKRVREAFNLALNRADLIKLNDGAATPLYSQIPPGVPGYNKDIKAIPYDPARAKALLAEAGYPGGKGLPPLKISSVERDKRLLAYYAHHFKTVLGVPLEVEVVERNTLIKNMNSGEVAFFPWGWTASYPDPGYLLDIYQSTSPYNRSRWKNTDFDNAFDLAKRTPDDAERLALYTKADSILMADWGCVPTVARLDYILVRQDLKGVHITPFRYTPFNDARYEK